MGVVRVCGVTIAAIALASCIGPDWPFGPANVGTTKIIDGHGVVIGKMTTYIGFVGAYVRISARGLPPGMHGVHLHQYARCDPPSFMSAGAHFNPPEVDPSNPSGPAMPPKQHGHLNPHGPHEGDLGNVTVGTNGRLRTEIQLPPAIGWELGNNNVALVIHALPDDERTDPDGNSGPRIACAVLA